MDLKLKGKRALVTGSSSGLGAAIARELAAEGTSVVVHGRDRERAEAVAAQCAECGVRSAVVLGSVASDADTEAMAQAALEALGGIDILVNCAGGVVTSDNPDWRTVGSQDWLDSFDLNVVSIIRLSQRLAAGMVDRGWGRIINISSVGAKMLSGRLLEYGSVKSAVEHVTGNLSRALAREGVTVNAVAPGTMLTPQAKRWVSTIGDQNGWPEDFAERERRYTVDFVQQPVPRLGRAEEIAAAVVFLASPRSDFTTGSIFRVDGGVLRGT